MKIVKGYDYMVTGHDVEQFCLQSYDFDSHSFTNQIRLHSVI